MKSEFLESELELYVQRLLIHESYSSGFKYRMLKISPREERTSGYDAKIVAITPFYCQFKTSDFLTKGPLFNKRIKFLASQGGPNIPFYAFRLRVPTDTADKKNYHLWQHNVLHNLWRKEHQQAAYVAPLFHTRLEMDLHEPVAHLRSCVFDCMRKDSVVSTKIVNIDGSDYCRLPTFDGLIAIPPHTSVSDLKHSYCFNTHQDITFHSESEMVDGGKKFSDRIRQFVEETVRSERQAPPGQKLTVTQIRRAIGAADSTDGDDDFMDKFLGYGLIQIGISRQLVMQNPSAQFENEATWLQQRLAFAAALSGYFGISTLGLVRIEES